MKLRHFSISQQGDSHIKAGTNCQDHSDTISVINNKLNIEFGIAAIADGVGSCDYSEIGSQIAVSSVLEYLKQELVLLENISENAVVSILKKAFQQANENIECEADKRERPFLLFDTTLTVTILTDAGICYVGHIGDDGVVALMADGSYSMITSRIEGEEANSVFPLSSTKYWTFAIAKKPVAALALMTDGLLDKSVGSTRMNNRVYYPFFKPMFENIMENDQDVIDLRAYWDEYLRDKEFREGYGVTDDITLAVVQLPSILKNVKPAPFDEEKWLKDSQEVKKEIEEALSESASTTTTNTNSGQQKIEPIEDIAEESIGNGSDNQTYAKSDVGQKPGIPRSVKTPVKSNPQSYTAHQTVPTNYSASKPNTAVNKSDQQSSTPRQSTIAGSGYQSNASNSGSTSTSSQMNRSAVPNSSNKTNPISNPVSKIIRIAIPIAVVLCLIGVGIVARNMGYNSGLKDGKQQEQYAMQQKLDAVRIAHEEELKTEYKRGVRDALSEPTVQPDIELTTPPPTISPDQFVISRGQKGEAVRTIQKKLRAKGWDLKTDGDYGPNTESTVREFQDLNSLPSTGEVDILTFWMLLNEESIGNESTQVTETVVPTDFNLFFDDKSVQAGSTIQVPAESPQPDTATIIDEENKTIDTIPKPTDTPAPVSDENL